MKSVEVRLVGRFRLERKIPGEHEHLLYSAVHTQNNSLVFLKGDETKKKTGAHKLSILQEGKILQTMQGGIGIPHMHWCGQEEDYNFIVLEELSCDLKKMLKKCNGKFSLKTTLQIGIEMISILQYYHFKNFLHCHLKPDHLMMGAASKYGKLYLIDYSSSVRFRDNQTLEHISEQSDKKIQTKYINMEFSTPNYHAGGVCSRKDDIISLLYLLAYFQKGSLPWSCVLTLKKSYLEKSAEILSIKNQIDPKQIFQGCPDLLMLYENTVKLDFEEKPRYAYYKNVFRQRLERQGYFEDGIYDWMLIPDEDEEFLEEFDLDIQIIPNEKEFFKKLEEQMKTREKIQAQKVEQEKKIEEKKIPTKQKDCVIF